MDKPGEPHKLLKLVEFTVYRETLNFPHNEQITALLTRQFSLPGLGRFQRVKQLNLLPLERNTTGESACLLLGQTSQNSLLLRQHLTVPHGVRDRPCFADGKKQQAELDTTFPIFLLQGTTSKNSCPRSRKDAACGILRSFTSFLGCITRLNKSRHKRLRIQRKESSAGRWKNEAGIIPKPLFNAQHYPRQVSWLTRCFLLERARQATESHICTDTGLPAWGQHPTNYVSKTLREEKARSRKATMGRGCTVRRAGQREEGASPS